VLQHISLYVSFRLPVRVESRSVLQLSSWKLRFWSLCYAHITVVRATKRHIHDKKYDSPHRVSHSNSLQESSYQGHGITKLFGHQD